MVYPTAVAHQHIVSKNRDDHFGFVRPNQDHDFHHGRLTAKQLIGRALRSRVENINPDHCDPGDEDAFFVADLGEVYRQHLRWKLNLPRVKPFYGMFNLKSTVLPHIGREEIVLT